MKKQIHGSLCTASILLPRPEPDIAEPLDLGGRKVVEGKLRPVLMTPPPQCQSHVETSSVGVRKVVWRSVGAEKARNPCTAPLLVNAMTVTFHVETGN